MRMEEFESELELEGNWEWFGIGERERKRAGDMDEIPDLREDWWNLSFAIQRLLIFLHSHTTPILFVFSF